MDRDRAELLGRQESEAYKLYVKWTVELLQDQRTVTEQTLALRQM